MGYWIDRQTPKETKRQTDKETNKQRDKHTKRETDKQNKQTNKETTLSIKKKFPKISPTVGCCIDQPIMCGSKLP